MQTTSFKRYRPPALRAWHWLNALALLGTLGTVLLRKTFLSWRTNSAYIQGELQEAGTTVTPELAKAIAVGLRDRMWEWHYIFGFTLAGLLVVRLLTWFFLPKDRSPPLMQAIRAVATAPAGQKRSATHNALVRTGYALFYASLVFMATTGFLMYWKASLGLGEDLVHSIKDVHELMLWFFVVFAGGHVLGVVFAEHRGDAGIVSDMIQGGRRD
ncbi:MAG: cytochrome b/b6 domain-containing protein [Pseudomonadota bacterium]|nr:cytochrome b/b6 domain-containing protein [Pseudomonadota bacterium]